MSSTALLLVAGLVLGAAATASAQDRLFALISEPVPQTAPQEPWASYAPSSLLEIDTRPASLGRVLHRTRFGAANGDLVSTGAGRYLVWTGPGTVHVVDTLSGVAGALPLPGTRRVLAADPARPRVFLDSATAATIVDGATLSLISVPLPAGQVIAGASYVPAGDRLFVVATTPPPSGIGPTAIALHVVNAATGALERSASLGTLGTFDPAVTAVAVDRAARRLFVQTFFYVDAYGLDDDGGPTFLARFGRGAPGGMYPTISGSAAAPVQIDEARRRVTWVIGEKSAGFAVPGLQAADLDTLAPVGAVLDHSLDAYIRDQTDDITHGEFSSYGPFRFLQAPRSPAYTFSTVYPSFESGLAPRECLAAQLSTRNPDTGALIQRANVLQAWGVALPGACGAQLVLQAQPAAPALTADVQGSQVTLSWTGIDDATHYDIEAGTAPGQANILASPGHTNTSLTVTGVPPGTYYVRVRAINWVGRSLPSTDIQVVVP